MSPHRADRKHGSFIKGFLALFRSVQVIIRNKGFVKFFIIPFVLNIVILIVVFYFSYTWFDSWFSSIFSGTAWYMTVIRVLLRPVLMVLLIIAMILAYSITGCIITAPFNDFISYKTEMLVTGSSTDEKFSIFQLLKDIFRITINIILLLLIMIVLNIIVVFFNLIPFFGQIVYTVLSFLMASFFIGFQFFDFPLERRRLGFSKKLWIAWEHKSIVAGLGAAFFIISYIPIVGFLGLNLGAVGATLLYIEHMKDEIGPEPSERQNGNR